MTSSLVVGEVVPIPTLPFDFAIKVELVSSPTSNAVEIEAVTAVKLLIPVIFWLLAMTAPVNVNAPKRSVPAEADKS